MVDPAARGRAVGPSSGPTAVSDHLQRSVPPPPTKEQLGAGAGPGKNISQHCPVSAIGGSAMKVTFTGSSPAASGYVPPLPVTLNFVMPRPLLMTNLNFLMPLMSGITVPA